MSTTITAQVHSLSDPEPLSNGGRKWFINLDNGSQVITYTWKLAQAMSEYIGTEFTFECDDPPFAGAAPKVARVTRDGELFWQPAPKPEGFSAGQSTPSGIQVPNSAPIPQRPAQSSAAPSSSWIDTSPAQNARHAVGCATAMMSAYISQHPDLSWDEAGDKAQNLAMELAAIIDTLWHEPKKTSDAQAWGPPNL